jgi:hypothetical protein
MVCGGFFYYTSRRELILQNQKATTPKKALTLGKDPTSISIEIDL